MRKPDPVAEWLAWLMDRSIPIGRWSIGLDPLLGLIPGLGDLLSSCVSLAIVVRAAQAGISRAALMRMLVNIGLDSLVGMIPVLGDLFDFAFRANQRNLRIYEESLAGLREPRRDWAFVALVLAGAVLLIAIPAAVLGTLLWKLVSERGTL